MVKLRLKRSGKKKAAFYRIVAIDARVKRDGKYIDLIGTYSPIDERINIQNDIAIKWLNQGAKPTETVRNLFSKVGIMKQFNDLKTSNNTISNNKEQIKKS